MAGKHGSQKPEYMPTPEQIAERKAEIQAEWTPAEEMRRRGMKCSDDCGFVRVEVGKGAYRFSSEIEGGGE